MSRFSIGRRMASKSIWQTGRNAVVALVAQLCVGSALGQASGPQAAAPIHPGPSDPLIQSTSSLEQSLRLKLKASPDNVDDLIQLADVLAREGFHKAAILSWQRAAIVRPADVNIHLSLAQELIEDGRNDEAIKELHIVLDHDSRSETAILNLGAALSRVNRFTDAAEAYKKALELEPGNDVAVLSLAKVYVMLQRYDDVLPYVEANRKQKAQDFEWHYLRAVVYRNLNRSPEAEDEFRQAIALKTDDYDAQKDLGAVLLANGKAQDAIACLRRATEIEPLAPEAHYLLFRAYQRSGQVTAAEQELQQTQRSDALDVQSAVLEVEAGRAFQQGDYTEAIVRYQSLIAMKPHNVKAFYDLALSYDRAGQREQERKALLIAEELDPAFPDTENQLGFLDMQDARLDAAKQHFLLALRSNPQHTAALGNLGVLCAETKNFEEAERFLRLAIETDPEYPAGERNLGLVLAGEGHAVEAETAVKRALKLSPEDSTNWLVMGEIQQQEGDKTGAIESFRRVVHDQPASLAAHLKLCDACLAASDFSCALDAANETIRLSPDLAVAHAKAALALCGLKRGSDANKEQKTALRLDPGMKEHNLAAMQCKP
jgi:tetratricopeptide (TPR) repeat protein